MTPEEAARMFDEAKALRQPYEGDWKRAVAYCTPYDYPLWETMGPPVQAHAPQTRRYAYDNTGVNALPKYQAILQRLITPDGSRWSKLQASNPELMKIYAVREYFDQLTETLQKYRYNPRAAFVQATGEMYSSIGVVGAGPVRVSWRKPGVGERKGTFRNKAISQRDMYVMLDDDGDVWATFVRFWLTAPQFKRKWPDHPQPPCIAAENQKAQPSNTNYFEFVHVVYPRDRKEYDPQRLDNRRFTHVSRYLCVQDKEFVGDDGGFNGNPYLYPRAATNAGGVYGISPAMMALPALGGVSATKKTMLKQGQKAVDPVILANDDGVLSGKVDLRPGTITWGGVDSQGRQLVRALEMGNFNVAEAILADDRRDINDSFFVTLFQILTETPRMTATEVIERVAEKAALLAPTMGRLQSEFLNPLIQRELNLLAEHAPQDMPEPPPEVIEAEGEYEVVYTSPMAKSLYAEEDAGFIRVLEAALGFANGSQDPSALDHFNVDVAFPEMADHRSVPTRWMNPPDVVQAKREQRAQQQQIQQAIDAGPAVASVATAAMKNETGSQRGVTQ